MTSTRELVNASTTADRAGTGDRAGNGPPGSAGVTRRDVLRATGAAVAVGGIGSLAGCNGVTPGSAEYCEDVAPPAAPGNDLTIQEKYDSLSDEARDDLGSPDGDGDVSNPGGTGRRREFEHGAIYWSEATGAHVVLKPSHPDGHLWDEWEALGWEQPRPESLRYPLSDQRGTRDGGVLQYFQGGLVYWSSDTGAIVVRDLPPNPPRPVLFRHKIARQGDKQRWYVVDRSIENLDVAGAKGEATSLYVPEGWSITVYDKTRFRGNLLRVQGLRIIPQLQDVLRARVGDLVELDWSDAIASVRVGRRSDAARYHYCNDGRYPHGELTLRWAGVVNNGEGPTGGPTRHGPDGNLHVLVYDDDEPYPGRQTGYDEALRHVVLTGPTEGKAEWDDGLEQSFRNGPLSLFRWRSADDAVAVFVYESDPDSAFTDREHDPLFFRRVTRRGTLDDTALFSGIEGCSRFPNPDRHCPTPDADVVDRARDNGAEEWLSRETDEELGPGVENMYVKLRTVPRAARYHDRLANSVWRYHETHLDPRYRGYPLDRCRRRAADCGLPAANAWARRRSILDSTPDTDTFLFADVVDVETAVDVGLTKIFASGELCEAAGCDGFQRITVKTEAAFSP